MTGKVLTGRCEQVQRFFFWATFFHFSGAIWEITPEWLQWWKLLRWSPTQETWCQRNRLGSCTSGLRVCWSLRGQFRPLDSKSWFLFLVRLTHTFLMERNGSQRRQHLVQKPKAENPQTQLLLPGFQLRNSEKTTWPVEIVTPTPGAQPGGCCRRPGNHVWWPEGWKIITINNIRENSWGVGQAGNHLSEAGTAHGFHVMHKLPLIGRDS